MKILFTTPGMLFGGAERVMSILANEWVDQKHSVRILITTDNNKCVYPLHEGAEFVCIGKEVESAKHIHTTLIKLLRKEILEYKPDVVVSFMNDVCAYTAIAMYGMKIPLIYSERNDPNKVNQSKKDKLYRRIVEKRADKIVFQTDGAKACYSKKVQDKSCVILNPLDLTRIPEYDFKQTRPEIVTVGRLEPQKNQKILIEAFSKVKDMFPEYCLKIYGSGQLENQLKEQIERLNLSERVFLMGNSTSVLQDIKTARLFVLTSDFEGLPNALIEAMAMGMPCISTDCSPGGARMLINQGKNGVIVPCGDSDLLAVAIQNMLKTPNTASSMGLEAKTVKEKVWSQAVAKQWLDILTQ